jgi:hypothetical protein
MPDEAASSCVVLWCTGHLPALACTPAVCIAVLDRTALPAAGITPAGEGMVRQSILQNVRSSFVWRRIEQQFLVSQGIVQLLISAGQACLASNGTDPAKCGFSISGHVLGGAYQDRPRDATAFFHRDAYFIIDGTTNIPTFYLPLLPPAVLQQAFKLTDDFLRWANMHFCK